MKKTILLFILIGLAGCSSQSNEPRFNSEIPVDLREETKKTTLRLIQGIKEGNDDVIVKLLSDELLNLTSVISKFKDEFQPIFQQVEFKLFDEYYKTLDKDRLSNVVNIVPKQDRSLCVHQIKMPGLKSYFQFWKTENEGLQHLLFIHLIQEQGAWKAYTMVVGDYAVNHLNTPDLMQKIQTLIAEDKLLSAAVYAMGVQKILRPSPFLVYKKEAEYVATINKCIKDINDNYKFPLLIQKDPEVSLITVGFLMKESGIAPTIKYVTPTNIEDKAAITQEADLLIGELFKMFPHIKDSFTHIIMKAYAEAPIDPNKKYKGYNTIYKNGVRYTAKKN